MPEINVPAKARHDMIIQVVRKDGTVLPIGRVGSTEPIGFRERLRVRWNIFKANRDHSRRSK